MPSTKQVVCSFITSNEKGKCKHSDINLCLFFTMSYVIFTSVQSVALSRCMTTKELSVMSSSSRMISRMNTREII